MSVTPSASISLAGGIIVEKSTYWQQLSTFNSFTLSKSNVSVARSCCAYELEFGCYRAEECFLNDKLKIFTILDMSRFELEMSTVLYNFTWPWRTLESQTINIPPFVDHYHVVGKSPITVCFQTTLGASKRFRFTVNICCMPREVVLSFGPKIASRMRTRKWPIISVCSLVSN